MIISASRRTDIPAFYPEWFMNRLREGEVLIPNPYNRKKITRIGLSPDTVDCIAFWTRNPKPMMPYLKELDKMGYNYYFQITITDYDEDVEPGAPNRAEAMASFLLLSEKLGKDKVDWRFDPILLNDKYTISYHVEQFEFMCEWLKDATDRCIISFMDSYKGCPYLEMEQEDKEELARRLSKVALKYHVPLYTCAERVDLSKYGIQHNACIDKERLYDMIGYKLDLKKDAGQRKECKCVESIDIGTYDTCINGCKYCYATRSLESATKKHSRHDVNSPLMVGSLIGDETITEREIQSNKDNQISIFDFAGMYKY